MNRSFLLGFIILLWIPASFVLANLAHQGMKFRVNDLSEIKGGGAIMRNAAGEYYHVVNPSSNAPDGRKIFPRLAPPLYDYKCLDCSVVSNVQLSRMREFCVAGIPNQMPNLIFENPCKSSIPLGKSEKTIWAVFFIVPLVVYFFIRSSKTARSTYNKTVESSRKNM